MSILGKASLTPFELAVLTQEFAKRKKSSGTMWLLWILIGGAGAHRFYLGHTGMGFLYLLLFLGVFFTVGITAIPLGILLLIDLFLNGTYYKQACDRLEQAIIVEIKSARSVAESQTAATR